MYFQHLGDVANSIVEERVRQAELVREAQKVHIKKDPWLNILREKLQLRLESLFV
jgi:hypothetical protein